MIQKWVVNWYHKYLFNRGMDWIEATIIQYYYRTNLREKCATTLGFEN